MTELIELMKNRRTIRKYRPEQISEEELQLILEAGQYAPSAGGAQSTRIVALQNRTLSEKLGKINVGLMKRREGAHVSDEQPSIIDDPSIPSGFYGAPTVCVIFSRTESSYSIADSFCSAENMILEAYSLNVSSAIIGRAEMTFDNDSGRELMKEWEIPENYTARCFVILGYLDGPYPSMKPRKENRIRIIR
ncbi:MAG: nitroreductase family protein [Erysipelotrichaceae bacterium]|nr:nitroreductase family protein [Erysipelotrichaceae bacterium]